jgi:Surface antigen variable number repeat
MPIWSRTSILVALVVIAVAFNAYAQNGHPAAPLLGPAAKSPFKNNETTISLVNFCGLDAQPDEGDTPIDHPLFEAKLLQLFRQHRISIVAGAKFDSVQIEKALHLIKDWTRSSGYADSEIRVVGQAVKKDRVAITFNINRGMIIPVSEVRIEGNLQFTEEELLTVFRNCMGNELSIYDESLYEYCSKKGHQRLR